MLEAPLIMPADATLAEAAAAMHEHSADCVFIGDDASSVAGIVSERDIVRQVRIPVTDSTRVREIPLHSIMSSPVITVGADDFMHVALGRMSRFDIRHLAVVDPAGSLVGWVSSRELVRQRVTAALVIGDRLATAETAGELAAGLRMLPTFWTRPIPYCTGNVMSRHDEWCRSLAEWRRAIGGWVRREQVCAICRSASALGSKPVQ